MLGEFEVTDLSTGFLPEGWERCETSSGIPYFLNHNDRTTQWEHPNISQVFIELDGMNNIKYGAYRTAMKLRAIQKVTHLNEVEHSILDSVFHKIGMDSDHNHNNEVLSIGELEVLLVNLFKTRQDRYNFIQPEKCVELTLNFILTCLDSGRTGAIKARSLKIILSALLKSSLEERYKYMFKQVSTENSAGISQSNLKTLFQDMLLLPAAVSEISTFGPEYIEDDIEKCWKMSRKQPTDTITEEEFKVWMLQREPTCVVWLPTLHRLATAETVKHEAKCSKCKAFPIVGFRYRCLKCSNVDLCQNCFWTQVTMKNHKLSHPTREYCLATTTGDDVRDFVKQVKNKITRRYRHKPQKSSPRTPRKSENKIPDQCPVFDNVHTRVNLLASRLRELEEGVEPLERTPIKIVSPSQMQAEITPTVVKPLLFQSPPPPPTVPSPQPTVPSLPPTWPSPIVLAPVVQSHEDLKAKLQLESRIIELQVNNQAEITARRDLEKHLTAMERSQLKELEARCELEQHVHDLKEGKKLLEEKVSRLLATPPLIKTVKVIPPTPPVQSPLASMVETRTQSVNTANQMSFPMDGWSLSLGSQTSSLLGGEEEEMEAILRELLAAFPKQTKKTLAID